MADTFTVEELAAYPGVAASEASLTLVAGIVNGLVQELLDVHGPSIARPAMVKSIALAVAAESLTNADGATTASIQLDDYKETRVYGDGSRRERVTGIGFAATDVGRLVEAITGQAARHRSIPLTVPGYTDTVDCGAGGWLPA